MRKDSSHGFRAQRVRDWLGRLSIKPLFIEPGSPWENGYVESFNGKMRDELLAGEIFYSLKEAQVLTRCGVSITILSDPTVHLVTSRQYQLLYWRWLLRIFKSDYLKMWYNFRGQVTG